MVGDGSERNPGTAMGDDMGVGGYVGGSQRVDEPRGRCGTREVTVRKVMTLAGRLLHAA